jgi:hypothetical protein
VSPGRDTAHGELLGKEQKVSQPLWRPSGLECSLGGGQHGKFLETPGLVVRTLRGVAKHPSIYRAVRFQHSGHFSSALIIPSLPLHTHLLLSLHQKGHGLSVSPMARTVPGSWRRSILIERMDLPACLSRLTELFKVRGCWIHHCVPKVLNRAWHT